MLLVDILGDDKLVEYPKKIKNQSPIYQLVSAGSNAEATGMNEGSSVILANFKIKAYGLA